MIGEIAGSGLASGQEAARAPGGNLGKDEFLKMLVAQMRNQDPLNPMQGDQMAVQLAQFSSLEQLTGISAGLESLTEVMGGQMLQTMHASSAMGALGRNVLAEGDLVKIAGDAESAVTVDVGGMGGTATLRVYDQQGREVGSREVGALSGGRQTLELGKAAEGLPAGTYTYGLDVVDASGEPVDVQTYVRARVDGVRYDAGGPILTAGGMRIPFEAVIEISSD